MFGMRMFVFQSFEQMFTVDISQEISKLFNLMKRHEISDQHSTVTTEEISLSCYCKRNSDGRCHLLNQASVSSPSWPFKRRRAKSSKIKSSSLSATKPSPLEEKKIQQIVRIKINKSNVKYQFVKIFNKFQVLHKFKIRGEKTKIG